MGAPACPDLSAHLSGRPGRTLPGRAAVQSRHGRSWKIACAYRRLEPTGTRAATSGTQRALQESMKLAQLRRIGIPEKASDATGIRGTEAQDTAVSAPAPPWYRQRLK